MRLLIQCTLVAWLLCKAAFAQINDIKFDHITSRQGLSHGTVYSVLQDKEGFMWFGTRDGLNRYDGYNFVIYEHDDGQPGSISNNNIRSLYEDRSGNIWVATSHGLNLYDKATDSFKVFAHNPQQPGSIGDNNIQVIYQTRDGVMWIGTSKGLNKYDPATDHFIMYAHNASTPNQWAENTIHAIYEDKSGNLWVGASRGLSLFDRKQEKFIRYNHYSPAVDSTSFAGSVRAILEDHTGVLWVGTVGDGLKQFNRDTKTYTVFQHDSTNIYSLSDNLILSLLEDSQKNLWIGTQQGGLNRYDRQAGKFFRYTHQPNLVTSIGDNSIMCIYEDRFKVLWVAGFKGGVNKVDLLKKKITHFNQSSFDTGNLQDNFVFSLYADTSGAIWVGNRMGLDKLDKKTGRFINYSYSKTKPKNLSDNTAHAIDEDASGNIWVGLSGGGLKVFNRQTKQFKSFIHDEADTSSLPNNYINALCHNKQGNMWVGTRNGLAFYDTKKERFTTYKPAVTRKSHYNVTNILQAKNGLLWLSTYSDGLNRFDPVSGQFTEYMLGNDPGEETVSYVFESQSGKLWVTLVTGGLYSFDPQTGQFETAAGMEAYSHMIIQGIIEDDKSNLWLATRKSGLYKYDPVEKSLRTYDVNDGLQGNEFNDAFCKDRQGTLYFGGSNGFNMLHPDSLQDNPYAPVVAISGFKVFDKARNIPQNREIILPYSDNFFSFDFVGLNYSLPEKNKYAYKLEGVDKDWIQAGTRRYTSYTNLDPGDYVFRVKAANYDGVWNQEGITLKICITPPFWKTIWAYIVYVFTIIGVLYAAKEYIVRQERLKNNLKLKSIESEKLQELDQLKSRFFANVSHELRTPLSLIISPLETIVSGQPQPADKSRTFYFMLKNARRLLQLINQLLDISKIEAGGMRLENAPGDIIAFTRAHFYSFASIADSRHIKLAFNNVLSEMWVAFDKDKTEKIITNLFSNAVKFTPDGGEITVTLSVKPDKKNPEESCMVELQVQDTGIGIDSDNLDKIFDRFYQIDSSHSRTYEGTGIGLALTKELVALYNGSISVSSIKGKGSCFYITLPLQKVHRGDFIENYLENQNAKLGEVRQASTGPVDESGFVIPLPLIPARLDEHAPLLLIVEDNTDLSNYIHATFNDTYRVIIAQNGTEGVDRAIELIPDLIISDWMMPQMTGMELCSILKTDERTSHIPLIMLTARAALKDKLEGLDTGADAYLTKPFNTEELVAQAKNLILQRKKLRERYSRTIATEPSVVSPTVVDEKFLRKVTDCLDIHLADPEFTVEEFEKELSLSHAQFNRKIKALTDQSPVEFMRDYRLKKAAVLLAGKQGNVSQIAYQVGFNNLSYFTRAFRKLYGMTPSEYALQEHKAI